MLVVAGVRRTGGDDTDVVVDGARGGYGHGEGERGKQGRREDEGEGEAEGTGEEGGGTQPTAEEVAGWVADYRAAHPGREGDINSLTPAEVAADPDAAQLLALCGDDQRPVIPLLAWEYGGSDHAWINPEGSALVYCVYTPVSPSTENWAYDDVADHVTADVYVLFPDENPCRVEVGAAQVTACIGDTTNMEILVDIASYGDGAAAGLSLSEASTELMLILTDGSKVHLWDG